ncbi:hypothetical protein B0H14DRAFT_3421317 [Mycena olivaceomarginata]|nr:hypothetical protein B0H14DRAFT_3421317 [Mycena olivaceomarginata]
MSRLTASPFHKPSPFEFPQRAGSNDTVPSNQHGQLPTPATTSVIGGHDPHAAEYFDTPTASISAADAGSRFRKVASSIVYTNSGLRESRERTVQRSSRSFVVVLPPPSLPHDHGHLGHTLSTGPRHRLSQGLLMPLFPTMYGQLTAIAREYNFPSTAGLCLYLHFTDNGITVTPRISDDSWQMIWSHAFDPTPGAAHNGLPISGKIEFDIDMRLARWYGAWMASSHREHMDVPMSVTPSAAPSVVHYREDSGSNFADGEEQDNHPGARVPVRHIPRKLSLIDRFDAMSARSVPRSVVARPSRPSPPDILPGSQNLPPIFQEDEPKTAKYDLEHRVNTWRASASIVPGAMVAEAAQIVLAGANLPNSPLDESPLMPSSNDDEQQDYEYRIEDYAFSISSAGPNDYDPYSPLDWYYDPSVHLANRAEGSVCMTPSTCTSFGPSDYTLPPHLLMPDAEYGVRTPDIAQRMFEDVPPSPSVATSWGAPLSFPPSPTSVYRALSVHLGDRQEFSRPVTPMTATSWGAPESFPPSPTTPFYVHTPDAGQRAFDLSDHDAPWALVWPYHDPSRPRTEVSDQGVAQENAAPWNMVWPYHTSEAGAQESAAPAPRTTTRPHHADHAAPQETAAPWNMVWPYHANEAGAQESAAPAPRNTARPHHADRVALQEETAAPWDMVWPYHASEAGAQESAAPAPRTTTRPHHADHAPPQEETAAPWNMVWPYHAGAQEPVARAASGVALAAAGVTAAAGIALAAVGVARATAEQRRDSPAPWNMVWPYHAAGSSSGQLSVAPAAVYPHLNIYPAVYPHFDLYPAASGAFNDAASSAEQKGPVTIIPSGYPFFNLYPVYPANLLDLYSTRTFERASSGISIRLAPRYAHFDLYPAVYPHVVPYPPYQGEMEALQVSSLSYYPHFNLYPPVATSSRARQRSSVVERGPVSVVLRTTYPVFNLYPAIYPVFDIYPGLDADADSLDRSVSIRLATAYPVINLYPAVYPAFDLPIEFSQQAILTSTSILRFPKRVNVPSTELSAGYPDFNIYPAVSRAPQRSRTEDRSEARALSTALSAGYPDFNIYPAVSRALSEGRTLSTGYPDFNIYPAVSQSRQTPRVRSANSARSAGTISSSGASGIPNTRYMSVYSFFTVIRVLIYASIDPPVYPVLNIYPERPEDCPPASRRGPGAVRSVVCYPTFVLYPPVIPAAYPNFEIYYPALPDDVLARMSQQRSEISVRVIAAYPIFDLYPAVYPALEIYPSLPDDRGIRSQPTWGISVRMALYPVFDLYPGAYPPLLPEDCAAQTFGYPHFNLYPSVGGRSQKNRSAETISPPVNYPNFNLYPAVYPYFDLYPKVVEAVARYPYFNLYPAVYPHFDLFPTILSIQEPRVRKMSRFTRSDLHALVKKAGLNPQRSVPKASKSHRDLHMAVFPNGADVSTPSGSVPRKTHIELHRNVFSSGEVSTPSGTDVKYTSAPPVRPPSTVTPSRPTTRLRSGSVLRQSLPPSPRPVGGRSPIRAAPAEPTFPIPPAPTDAPRRTVSTTTRPSVADRVALKGASLTRSVSMASSPSSSIPEPSKLDRASSVSGPRKRDSMVLQRVRALNSGLHSEPTIKEDDPLANFPLPPRGSIRPPRNVVS